MIKIALLLIGCAVVGIVFGAFALCKICHSVSEFEKKIYGHNYGEE